MTERFDPSRVRESFLSLLADLEELLTPRTNSVKAFIRGVRESYGQRLDNEGDGLSTESLVTDLVGVLSDLETRISDLETRISDMENRGSGS